MNPALESTTSGQLPTEESTPQGVPDGSPLLMADGSKANSVGRIPVSQDEGQLLQHAGRQAEEGPDNQSSLEYSRPEASVQSSDEEEAAVREAAMQQIARNEKMNPAKLMSGMSEEDGNEFPTAPERPVEVEAAAESRHIGGSPYKVISEKKSLFASIAGGIKNIITAPARALNKVKETTSSAWNWILQQKDAFIVKLKNLKPLPKSDNASPSTQTPTPTPA